MASKKTLRTILDPRGQPTGIFGRRLDSDEDPDAILDPDGQPVNSVETFEGLRLAPRLDTIDNKTLYLIDVGFEGGFAFLEEVMNWLAQHKPAVTTVLQRKQGAMWTDDPALWSEIKQHGHAVIIGVGG